jgi:hypothetical protein
MSTHKQAASVGTIAILVTVMAAPLFIFLFLWLLALIFSLPPLVIFGPYLLFCLMATLFYLGHYRPRLLRRNWLAVCEDPSKIEFRLGQLHSIRSHLTLLPPANIYTIQGFAALPPAAQIAVLQKAKRRGFVLWWDIAQSITTSRRACVLQFLRFSWFSLFTSGLTQKPPSLQRWEAAASPAAISIINASADLTALDAEVSPAHGAPSRPRL